MSRSICNTILLAGLFSLIFTGLFGCAGRRTASPLPDPSERSGTAAGQSGTKTAEQTEGASSNSKDGDTGDSGTAIVQVESAQMYSPNNASEFSASITPVREMDVAFKNGGYVESIYMVSEGGVKRPAQAGDPVSKGTILGRLRQSDYLIHVREAAAAVDEITPNQVKTKAVLAEAEASLAQARQNFSRTSELYESKSATRPDYDSAKTNLEVSEARVQQAKAQMAVNDATQRRLRANEDESKLSLADAQLRSPMSGVITKRYIEIGSLVAQGTAAFKIADTSFVKVSFGVPDIGLVHLKLGDRVTIVSEALPGREFTGRITEIAPQADPESKVFTIGVMLPNPGNVLRLGMITSLKVNTEGKAKTALTVPLNAVVRSSKSANGYAVFVVREQNGKSVATERAVEIGQGYGRLVTVHGDIASGDKVVTIGNNRIINGQEVRISE